MRQCLVSFVIGNHEIEEIRIPDPRTSTQRSTLRFRTSGVLAPLPVEGRRWIMTVVIPSPGPLFSQLLLKCPFVAKVVLSQIFPGMFSKFVASELPVSSSSLHVTH